MHNTIRWITVGLVASALGCGGGGGDGGGDGGGGGGDGGSGADGAVPGHYGSFMFSVGRGASGLPGTAVNGAGANAASGIYATDGEGASHVDGTNTSFADAAALGLLPTDDVDSISALHPPDKHSPLYFSVTGAAGPVGLSGTGIRAESDRGEAQGDVFSSIAFINSTVPGNAWVYADEVRLGLVGGSAARGGGPVVDELDAFDWTVAQPPPFVYFSVTADSVGAAGSAVEGVAADERACTIFQSNLSGTSSVVWTCADLGLAPGDDVDALVVRGFTAPELAIFSVTPGSNGAGGSAVSTEASNSEAAADVYDSLGTGTNELALDESQLGLEADDDVDALGMREMSAEEAILMTPPPSGDPLDPGDPGRDTVRDVLFGCAFPLAPVADPGAPTKHTLPTVTAQIPDLPQTVVRMKAIQVEESRSLVDLFVLFTTGGLPAATTTTRYVPEIITSPAPSTAGPSGSLRATAKLGADFPLDDDSRHYQYAFVFKLDADQNYQGTYECDWFNGTRFWAELVKTPGGMWRLKFSQAIGTTITELTNVEGYVMVLGDTVTIEVKTATLPAPYNASQLGVRFTAFRHTGDYGQSGPWSGAMTPEQADGLATVPPCAPPP